MVPGPYGPHGKIDRFGYERLQVRTVTKTAFGVVMPVAAVEDLAVFGSEIKVLPEPLRNLFLVP